MISQPEQKRVKYVLPNPSFEHRIIFRKDAIKAIKMVKGWSTNAEMARAMGITRQYLTMLEKTRVGATATIITRLAALMGNTRKGWWIFFEIVPYGVSDQDHPAWNYEKYMGRHPYKSRFGEEYNFRGKTQYKTEARDSRSQKSA
ncbi:MAG TPA: hypothetical protein DCL42_04410 [Deltaproteobacteria bacterium]|nr:hypothetical protein [Deltaproteobacteria bacterium]